MILLSLIHFSSCLQTSNSERWNSFLNFGIKNVVNDSYLVHVVFKNESPYPVNIFKTSNTENTINSNGVIEATLDIGEKRKISCTIGDTFLAKVNSPNTPYDNLLLLAYDVSRVYVNDYSCPDKELILCERKPFEGNMRWTPPDSLMFSNFVNYDTSLYFWDGVCEEYIEKLSHLQDYHIMSTIGHTFRIRNSKTQKLLIEYKYEEVSIKGLENENDYEISEKATELFDTILLQNLKNSINTQQNMIRELELSTNEKNINTC